MQYVNNDLCNVLITLISAFWHLVSPHADTRFTVVGKSRAALVFRCFAVPAIPEGVAFFIISEYTIETLTMGCGDWWFKLASLAAFNIVNVITIFSQKFGVR